MDNDEVKKAANVVAIKKAKKPRLIVFALLTAQQWRQAKQVLLTKLPDKANDINRLFAKDPTLERLDLSSNAIGDEGAKAIAVAITGNTTLTVSYSSLVTTLLGMKEPKPLRRQSRATPRLQYLSLMTTLLGM